MCAPCLIPFQIFDDRWAFDDDPTHPPRIAEPVVLPTFAKQELSQIACGTNHVLALTRRGVVYAWGACSAFQTGRQAPEKFWQTAVQPQALFIHNIVRIGAGWSTSFAVNKEGLVYGWGLNHSGQVGIGGEDLRFVETPTLINALRPGKHGYSKVIRIVGGYVVLRFPLDVNLFTQPHLTGNSILFFCSKTVKYGVADNVISLLSDLPTITQRSLKQKVNQTQTPPRMRC